MSSMLDMDEHAAVTNVRPAVNGKSTASCRKQFGYQPFGIDEAPSNDAGAVCEVFMTVISIVFIVLTFPFSLCVCIKVVQEYERAVIFRLGRICQGGAKGPGIFFIFPCMDRYCKVDLRTVSFNIPPQEILTRDAVTVAVDAVVYYRIFNPTVSITNVEDANRSTRLVAQTTLRNVLGTKKLSELLEQREEISHSMQSSLDEATDPWGIKVERVEFKDVRLPVQLQRAMAAEAEATREAYAKVIAAEGEQKASRALKEAAEVISSSPAALQLRYLQTLNNISAEKNSTIIFPLPMDMLGSWGIPRQSPAMYHSHPGVIPSQIPPTLIPSVHQEPTAPPATPSPVSMPAESDVGEFSTPMKSHGSVESSTIDVEVGSEVEITL